MEIIFHPLVMEFFWRQEPEEVERLIRRNISRFVPVRQHKIDFSPDKIISLEKALNALKNLPTGPLFTLLPFSVAPEGSYKKALLRPGKIYVSASKKEVFERSCKELPFLAKLVPWQGLYELQIPATSDPDLLFRYRDLLLVGPFKPCLHCGLPWHRSANCPGRQAKTPGKALLDLLHEPLENSSRRLNRAFEEWPKQGAEWNRRFSERYYYLQPGFLRHLFASRAKNWSELDPFSKTLASGGKLSLALEALQLGHLQEAKRRFEDLAEEHNDWRALVGLAMLNLDREDLVKALYYVESALTQNDSPLVQGYLLFFKGWLFEHKNDLFKAEEAYRDALRKDRSCFPARFHLCLFMTRYHLWEEVLQHLPLLCQEPLGFLSTFLEPRFWPIAPQVEDFLQDHFKKCQARAAVRLAAAENNLRPILQLLPEKQAEDLKQNLEDLRKQIYEGGLYDFLQAEQQGLELSLEAQGLLYRQVKELRQRFSQLKEKFLGHEAFWRSQGERDVEFRSLLDRCQKKLSEIEAALSQNPTGRLRFCAKKLEQVEKDLEDLHKAQHELQARLRLKHQLFAFIKSFVVMEVFLFLIFLLYPRLTRLVFPQTDPYFFSPEIFFVSSLGVLVLSIFKILGQKN